MVKKSFISLFILFVSMLFCSPLYCADTPPEQHQHSGYDRSKVERTFYWYKDEYKEEKKQEDKKEDTAKETPPEQNMVKPAEKLKPADLWTMPPKEFRKVFEDAIDTAYVNPSIENVKYFIELKDIAMKKSTAFGNVYTLVNQMYPEYTTNLTYPVAVPGIEALYSMKEEEMSGVIQNAREDYALIYFYRPTCKFCVIQNQVLLYFNERYKWEIRAIDINESPEMSHKFNVIGVPYIIVVYKKDGNYMPVVSGVTSIGELEANLYRAIRYLSKEIQPSQYNTYGFALGTAEDPEAGKKDDKRNE